MNTTNGRIAERSKHALINALLKVMEQYNFREITVTQIAQEADLSRKTFYHLFKDKQEVLNFLLQEMVQEFFSELALRNIHDYWTVVDLYFSFWESKRKFLILLKKNDLLFVLYEVCYQHSVQAFTLVRSKETEQSFSETLPFLLAYSLGGMNSMLMKWIECDMKPDYKLFIEQLKNGYQSAVI